MRVIFALLISCLALPALARGEKSGEFDYYVLAMSWSPNWCALEGDARGSEQCERDLGWSLHGLWPQFERGWPSYCPSAERNPSRAMTGAMADIMGTSGLAWHQWNKHGTCAGVSAEEYYSQSRFAYEQVVRPPALRQLERRFEISARVIEEAFLQSNPGLQPDMITITCRSGHIQEARICLTKGLVPRACGADVVRDCQMKDAIIEPVR
ncbi:MAG: ribonuclease T2 [Pseudomonadota bacterium]